MADISKVPITGHSLSGELPKGLSGGPDSQRQGSSGVTKGLAAGAASQDDFREVRKTKKGAVESADVKARFNLA